MANKDSIIHLPNPSLRIRSKKVGIIDQHILDVISDMESATIDWENSRKHEVGVALAAVQINIHLRIVVIRNNFDDKEDTSFITLINPEIIKTSGKIEHDYEGCLSIKDVYGFVPRYTRVKIKALNKDGKEVRIGAEGFLARILQHEIDHTNGIVFIDHIKEVPDAFFKLNENGKLKSIDYDKHIKRSDILWQ